MIACIQRVAQCSVTVDGCMISSIGRGLLIFLGVHKDDTDRDITLLVRKCLGLRIFPDSKTKMNLSISDVHGELCVVSEFTLLGDVSHGLRPFFGDAAEPEKAKEFYEQFMKMIHESGISIVGGVFGAHMEVSMVNDGPVTILLDSRNL